MSQQPEPEMKQASQERLDAIAEIGDPIADYLQQMKPSESMEVMMYVIARLFLDVGLAPGLTKLEAFDKYITVTRHTLEQNMKRGMQ